MRGPDGKQHSNHGVSNERQLYFHDTWGPAPYATIPWAIDYTGPRSPWRFDGATLLTLPSSWDDVLSFLREMWRASRTIYNFCGTPLAQLVGEVRCYYNHHVSQGKVFQLTHELVKWWTIDLREAVAFTYNMVQRKYELQQRRGVKTQEQRVRRRATLALARAFLATRRRISAT